MMDCPFCSDVLLRHVRTGRAYWFCRSCRLEVLATGDPVVHLRNPELSAIAAKPLPATPYPLLRGK
jgi:ribosomal protein L37AE/L43A